MIITCPSCSTRYALDPLAVGTDGRRVRCARCGHTWLAVAPPEQIEGAPPPAMPPATFPDGTPMPPETDLPAIPPPPSARMPRGSRAGWAALALVTLTLLAVIFTARDGIVELWPPALRLYQTLGLDAAAGTMPGAGTGLTLRNVSSEMTAGAGGDVLWIRGEVANTSDVARPVPALQVALTGPDGQALHRWSFTVGVDRLAPGETARFETSLRNPDAAAAKLEITVADGAS